MRKPTPNDALFAVHDATLEFDENGQHEGAADIHQLRFGIVAASVEEAKDILEELTGRLLKFNPLRESSPIEDSVFCTDQSPTYQEGDTLAGFDIRRAEVSF